MTSSSDQVAQLEAQLQKVKAKKAACKAVEKVAAEAKRITEEKAVAETGGVGGVVEIDGCSEGAG